jgi:Chaperone of endosialidase
MERLRPAPPHLVPLARTHRSSVAAAAPALALLAAFSVSGCSSPETPAPPSSPCPSGLPTSGGACSRRDLRCEYGRDPRRECLPSATCQGVTGTDDAAWTIENPNCSALPAVQCPASVTAARGQSCSPKDAWCSFPAGGRCRCTDCIPGPQGDVCTGPPVWRCEDPQPVPGCPAFMPRIGDACGPLPGGAVVCSYGCGFGAVRCVSGVWQRDADVCPMSSRDVKTAIRYLTDAEEAQLAREVEGLKLARYRYKPGFGSADRHLGFIIEDVGDVPAVTADRKHVDLYGYASMLAAAVKNQARQIRTLQAEVRLLRDQASGTPRPRRHGHRSSKVHRGLR